MITMTVMLSTTVTLFVMRTKLLSISLQHTIHIALYYKEAIHPLPAANQQAKGRRQQAPTNPLPPRKAKRGEPTKFERLLDFPSSDSPLALPKLTEKLPSPSPPLLLLPPWQATTNNTNKTYHRLST